MPSALWWATPKHERDCGERAEKCALFAQRLGSWQKSRVKLWDERSTTVSAHNIPQRHRHPGQKRKNVVDAVAATIILESYLAYRKTTPTKIDKTARFWAVFSSFQRGFIFPQPFPFWWKTRYNSMVSSSISSSGHRWAPVPQWAMGFPRPISMVNPGAVHGVDKPIFEPAVGSDLLRGGPLYPQEAASTSAIKRERLGYPPILVVDLLPWEWKAYTRLKSQARQKPAMAQVSGSLCGRFPP